MILNERAANCVIPLSNSIEYYLFVEAANSCLTQLFFTSSTPHPRINSMYQKTRHSPIVALNSTTQRKEM